MDILTETFGIGFYGLYIAKWPEYCISVLNKSGAIFGYLLGKVEGDKSEAKKDWHGHVSAVTVAPQARRQGIAKYCMDYLEMITDRIHNGWFVDLFVREDNKIAIEMYQHMGYKIYRTVNKYYSATEKHPARDALDMRKSMKRDVTGITSVPTGKTIEPKDLEWN